MPAIALIALAVIGSPSLLEAQEDWNIRIGLAAGVGKGPTSVDTWNLTAQTNLAHLLVRAEYGDIQGTEACLQFSTLCDVTGSLAAVSLGAAYTVTPRLTMEALIGGGRFDSVSRSPSPAAVLDLSTEFRLLDRISLLGLGQYARAFDETYEDRTGKHLDFWIVSAGMAVHLF